MSLESECTVKSIEQQVNKESEAGWKTDVKILKSLFDNTDLTRQNESIPSRENQKPANSKETDDLVEQRRVERDKSREEVEGHFEIPEIFTRPHSNRCMSVVLEGHKVFFSRDVLFLLSPDLCNMVESAISEYSNLPITCEEFVTLLKCVYPNMRSPVKDPSSVAILLRLGKQYNIPSVLRKCEDYLMEMFARDRKTFKDSAVVSITLMAEKKKLTRLLEMCCQEAVGRPIINMMEMSEYRNLSTNTKLRISRNKLHNCKKINNEWAVKILRKRADETKTKIKRLAESKMGREPIQETDMFMKPQIFHTLTVQICGTSFYASKEIMALASPVFRKKIEDSLTEDRHGNKVIELEEDSVDTFLIILKALHPPYIKCCTESNVKEVLKLIEKYQLSSLRDVCDRTLLSQLCHPDTEIPMEKKLAMYTLAVQYNLPLLRKFILESISWENYAEFHSFVASEEIPEIDLLHVVNMRLQEMEKLCGVQYHMDSTPSEIKTEERQQYFKTCHSDTDVILVLGSIRLYVNSEVLQIASEYFRERIESYAKRKNPDAPTNLEIPIEDDVEDIVKMLGLIYPNMLDTVDESEAPLLLPLTKKYGISSLVGCFERALVNHCLTQMEDVSDKTLIEYVQLAERYDLSELLDICKLVALEWQEQKQVYLDDYDMNNYYDDRYITRDYYDSDDSDCW